MTTESATVTMNENAEDKKKEDANRRRSEAMQKSWAKRKAAKAKAAASGSTAESSTKSTAASSRTQRKYSRPAANSQSIQAKVKAASTLLDLCGGDDEAAKTCVDMVRRMSDMT